MAQNDGKSCVCIESKKSEFLVCLDHFSKYLKYIRNFEKQSKACLIYTFALSFSSSFAFQANKFTSSYICNSNDKWNDILNDWMLSVQIPFAVSQKRYGQKITLIF